ncbi:tail protein X [Microvirga brassicacearum]|uniref:Phage tail protein n=1 Tax=Microvirga brassicacearum TaxID=2580413 RepID=A0A5N3PH59_9HYPH|nr:tail protein X [Microvirga brassicacearum]KAB0269076.1 phage tail protein [Microvirga brassicacearum]
MTTTVETYTVATEGLTLSGMVWRRFKKPMFGMVERILAMNQNLASVGPYLPVGTKVSIPIDPPSTDVLSRPVVQLWD